MRKRQGLLIIMDGLGDRPDPVLGGMTVITPSSEDITPPPDVVKFPWPSW